MHLTFIRYFQRNTCLFRFVLLAQDYSSQDASLIGSGVHGLAGDFAARKKNEITMTAMDLVDCLTEAFGEIVK